MSEPGGSQGDIGRGGGLRTVARDYSDKLRLFQRNARLYLAFTAVSGVALGVYRLLYNFYVLGLGFDEALLGRLITTSSLAALLAALPAGYVSDRMGRKVTLLTAGVTMAGAAFGMVLWPSSLGLYLMNALLGVSQALAGVTLGPFLMENSSEEERTYLFSFASGINMIAGFVGSWLGGTLPTWLSQALRYLPQRLPALGAWLRDSGRETLLIAVESATPESVTAYAASLVVIGFLALSAVIPLALIRRARLPHDDLAKQLTPITYARRNPGPLAMLIGPVLITSLGAGLFMPFMNVFYRNTFDASDQTIGTLFASASLAMAVGLLIAPPLADRYGKIQLVVVSQSLSIPFLILLGYSPWFGLSAAAYLVRLALMNMSTPVYQAFVMEHAPREARATVASLVSMSWNVGWAFSPSLSGWMQVSYGFGPVFGGVIVTYVVAIYMYWRFFLRESPEAEGRPVSVTAIGRPREDPFGPATGGLFGAPSADPSGTPDEDRQESEGAGPSES